MPPPAPSYAPLSTTWKLGEVHDVGPAGPMTATPAGIYLVTKTSELRLAKRKGASGFASIDAEKTEFAKYARGPAIGAKHAYWITLDGKLVRALLPGGSPELLAEGAHSGTRVSVVRSQDRDVVAFVRDDEGQALAFLWAEATKQASAEIIRVSPEGSAATSVALVPTKPHPRIITLEGRTSMSPVHARTVRVTQRRLNVDPDEVVWVGPGSHSLTELVTIDQNGGDTMALVATAKDITTFGLAQLWVDGDGGESAAPNWRLYPNGLDPAPVKATHLCDGDYAFFAVPTEARPHSPQELRVARFKLQGLGGEEVIARSRAFNDISVAQMRGGAVVAWTADRRTWAMMLGCPAK